MAFDEVTALLEQYEQIARERGSLAIERLQPGLTSAELEQAEARYGFALSEDIKAIWSWHNGTGPAASPDTPIDIGAGWRFMDLDTSIEYAQSVLSIWNDGDADRYVYSRWVTFDRASRSDVIETSNAQITDSSVLVADITSSVLTYPILTVAEKLRWFIRAIESGAWYVDERGDWQSNFDLYPTDAMRHIL